jgi:type I restriction enzyme S subunit
MSEPISAPSLQQYEAFLQQLPADWTQEEIVQLGAVVGGGTPSREVPSFWRGPIPWVTPGEVSGEEAKLLHDTADHISASGLAGSGANLLPAGSLLVTTRATLGARAINAVPMATNQGFKSIVFKKPEEASYYFHLFEKVKPQLVRRASGTTFLEISGTEFGSIKVPSPSPDEKLKIALLLDTIDTAIHQTKAIVEKLSQVKAGMLHDLLTRGMDVNGELRSSHDEAPDLYQGSPLGWRPKDWEICRVASVLAGIDAGKSPDCQDVPAKGNQWGVLKVGAVHSDGLKLDENKVVEENRLKNPAYLVRDGDLLLSRANTFELVGLVCYVTNHPERLMLSDKTLRLSVRANRMTTPFLFWQLQHPKTRTQIEIAATGTSGSMKNISQGGVEQLWISRPLTDEQEEITKRLGAAANRYRDEQEKLSKMRELKCGLMDDLLTGRVRVTPLLR